MEINDVYDLNMSKIINVVLYIDGCEMKELHYGFRIKTYVLMERMLI